MTQLPLSLEEEASLDAMIDSASAIVEYEMPTLRTRMERTEAAITRLRHRVAVLKAQLAGERPPPPPADPTLGKELNDLIDSVDTLSAAADIESRE
jgi:hypothetical protein